MRSPSVTSIAKPDRAKPLVAVLALLGLMFGQCISTLAEPVTYIFDGHVLGVEGLDRMPSIGVNEPFSGAVSIDTSLPNLVPDLPDQGEYRGGTMSFSIAGKRWVSSTYPVAVSTLSSSSGRLSSITFSAVYVDTPEPVPLLDGSRLYQLIFTMMDPVGAFLSDNGFPVNALAVGKFEQASGMADFYSEPDCFLCTAFIVIDHFSLLPVATGEPDSVTLLICAIALVAYAGRQPRLPAIGR